MRKMALAFRECSPLTVIDKFRKWNEERQNQVDFIAREYQMDKTELGKMGDDELNKLFHEAYQRDSLRGAQGTL